MAEKTRFNIAGSESRSGEIGQKEKPLHPRRCELCAYWEPPEINKDAGQCVANYPALFPVGTGIAGQIGAVAMFPPMKAGQRCAKWISKEDEEKRRHQYQPM